MNGRFGDLLDTLAINAGGVVFLHTSFGRLSDYFQNPQDLIEALRNRLGPDGTLVMPRFAWHLDHTLRPWQGYRRYLDERPPLDLRSTPANIGIVPETFRTLPGVEVSLHYFWPICAAGPRATTICGDQLHVAHPYGPGASFHKLLQMNATVLGLGVSLNTSSLSQVTDYEMSIESPYPAFTRESVGTIIDLDGNTLRKAEVTLRPELVRDARPSAVFEAALVRDRDYRLVTKNENIFFSIPALTYHQAAMALGRNAVIAGAEIPWLPGHHFSAHR